MNATHLSLPLLVTGLKTCNKNDDSDDDSGHNGSRRRNDDVVQLLAPTDALRSNLTALVVGDVVGVD